MPYKRRDSWYTDVRPPGYSKRIAKSCGRGTSKRVAQMMEGTLRELALSGRHDLLDALRAGAFTLADLHAAKVGGRLDDLVRDQRDPPLREALRPHESDPRLRWAVRKILTVAPSGARVSWLAEPANLRQLQAYYARHTTADSEHREWQVVNAVLREHFGEAKRVELMQHVKLRRPDPPRDRHLTPAEIAAVERVAGDWWLPIELTLAAGLRQGELLRAKIEDLDLENGAIVVRHGKSRRSRRRVPLQGRVVADLRGWIASQWLEAHDPIFPGVTRYRLVRAWRRIRKAAGIPEVRWHDLRHTWGVYCVRAGVPLTDLQRWMGHSKLTTTARYLIYAPEERSHRYGQAVGAMGLGSVPTPDPTPGEADELSVVAVEDSGLPPGPGSGATLSD